MQKQGPADQGLTPSGFVSEVQAFRLAIVDPTLSADDKRRAFCLIVHRAAMLKPGAAGFEGAGVALKDALCAWLDYHPAEGH
jgi:hypothetical protein